MLKVQINTLYCYAQINILVSTVLVDICCISSQYAAAVHQTVFAFTYL